MGFSAAQFVWVTLTTSLSACTLLQPPPSTFHQTSTNPRPRAATDQLDRQTDRLLLNMADDDSNLSDLSSLSSLSPAPSDDENDVELKNDKGILKFFHKLPKGTKPTQADKEPSPPPRKRSPSPPHDYVLADNPAIAVSNLAIIAFKTRNFAW